MGLWDSIKSVGSKIASAVMPKNVKRFGEKVWSGIKNIGAKAHDAVRMGQNILSKAEAVGGKIGNLPVVGDLAKRAYEALGVKNLRDKAKEGLNTAERITGNVAKGDINAVAKDVAAEYLKRRKAPAGGLVGADELD